MKKAAAFLLLIFAFVGNAFAGRIELRRGDERCAVETLGARIVSYSVRGVELLWMPEDVSVNSNVWRHGGIALAWPWFGRLGAGDRHVHGYAWKSDFKISSRTAHSAVLTLTTESAALEYAIRLDGALVLELKTTNLSKFDLPVGMAFHPYFRVGERDVAVIEGFDVSCVQVTDSVDRSVRFDPVPPRHECIVRDFARNMALKIVSEGATGLNLWNPGREKLCPGVIPGDEWRRFIAVEPFAMGVNRFLVLPAGGRHMLKMSLTEINPEK